MYIEVNNSEEDIKKNLISSDIIENVYRDDSQNKTVLILSDKTRLFIEESYQEIKDMLVLKPMEIIQGNENIPPTSVCIGCGKLRKLK